MTKCALTMIPYHSLANLSPGEGTQRSQIDGPISTSSTLSEEPQTITYRQERLGVVSHKRPDISIVPSARICQKGLSISTMKMELHSGSVSNRDP